MEIVIFTSYDEYETIPVDNFNEETIKSALGSRKDFTSISLINGKDRQDYLNGIIMDFDNVLKITENNPIYREIREEINRYRINTSKDEKYIERVIFFPYSKEFKILYEKPNLISELIPSFKVDEEPWKQMFMPYTYSSNEWFFDLFDRFVNIVGHESYIEYVDFDFYADIRDYDDLIYTLKCYEKFYIDDSELYNKLKKELIERYKRKTIIENEKTMKRSVDDLNDPNIPYSQIMGIKSNFTDVELKEALSRTIKLIQMQYDGDEREKQIQIDKVLDIYNTLSIEDRKDEYERLLEIKRLNTEDQNEASKRSVQEDVPLELSLKREENKKKYERFYEKNKVLFLLFDRFVNIVTEKYHIKYVDFYLSKRGYDYKKMMNFFECYEAYFNIRDIELYNSLKNSLIEKNNSRILESKNYKDSDDKTFDTRKGYEDAIKELKELPISNEESIDNKTYYDILGITPDFTLEELKRALSESIKIVQQKFDGDKSKIEQEIDKFLDMYKILVDEKRKKTPKRGSISTYSSSRVDGPKINKYFYNFNNFSTMENPYIGKDGQDYYSYEELMKANRDWESRRK